MERKEPISQCPIIKALSSKKKLKAECFKTLLRKEKVVEVKVAGSEYLLSSVIVALGALGITKMEPVLCTCLLYTSPSPRDATLSRMPSSA